MAKRYEVIKAGKKVIAVVVKKGFRGTGNIFFTDGKTPFQIAHVGHKKGKIIKPHYHNAFKRIINKTQEVDYVKKGKMNVSLYTKSGRKIKSVILGAGDMVLFASGGHGYRALENIDLMMIKQGPYAGKKDKTYLNV